MGCDGKYRITTSELNQFVGHPSGVEELVKVEKKPDIVTVRNTEGRK